MITKSQLPSDIRGRYVIGKQIASGWSSNIFIGKWHQRNGKSKAVIFKLLKHEIIEQSADVRPHLIEAMSREALALFACSHSYVPKFVEWLWFEDNPCIVMEKVPGTPLTYILQHSATLEWAMAYNIICKLLKILEHVHSCGWIHSDLNPGNILLYREDVYLIDFGAAFRPETPPYWEWPLGRHRFMSPEQLLGCSDVPRYRRLTTASDLHQIGCLLSYLLLGQEPFRSIHLDEDYSEDYLKVLGKWMSQSVEQKLLSVGVESRRPDVPLGVDRVLEQLLEPNPDKRLSSASKARKAFEAL